MHDERKMKAYISPHWFKFTIPKDLSDHELETVCKDLFGYRFSQFDKLYKSRDKYRNCYTLSELVSVYRDGWMDNKDTTCFDVSGTGLDTLGLDIAELGKYCLDNGGNICRIDLAALDTGNYLPYEELYNCCLARNFKQRVRTRFNRGVGNVPDIKEQPIRRIQFGSEKSDNYIVIYDRQQTEKLDFPCICIEQRIANRADNAEIVRRLLSGEDPGSYFAGLLRGKLEFLEDSETIKRLRKPEKWWTGFLGDCERRKIRRTKRHANPWPQLSRRVMRNIGTLHKRGDRAGLNAAAAYAQQALAELDLAA